MRSLVKGDRGTQSKVIPSPRLVYGFLTMPRNAFVAPIHPKTMPAVSRQVALLRSMIEDLERTIQIMHIDFCTEKKRLRVLDKADPLYSVLARTLSRELVCHPTEDEIK